jgi:hypothetical protein
VRPTLALVATLAAVIAGTAVGSAPAESVEANGTAAVPDVSYLFHITFNVTYEVKWRETKGSPTDECGSWRIDRGSNTVLGFPVDGDELGKLRNLKPGESYSSDTHLQFGECEDGGPLSRCEYSADVEWTIRRWTGKQAGYP